MINHGGFDGLGAVSTQGYSMVELNVGPSGGAGAAAPAKPALPVASMPPAPPMPSAGPGLPPGWSSHVDPASGEIYYVDAYGGSQWTPP